MFTSRKQTSSIQSQVIKELEAAPNLLSQGWTKFEIDMVIKYYGKKDTRVIAKALNKSTGAISRKASELQIPYYRK